MFRKVKTLAILSLAAVLFSGSGSRAELPPDPENAALLYYQAFLLYDKPESGIAGSAVDIAKGKAEPTAEFRHFLASNQYAINLVLDGVKRKSCHWGVLYSKGFDAQMPNLGQARQMAFLILADARVKALDGKIEQALSQVLAVKKLAEHVNDGVIISYLVRVAIDNLADSVLLDIAGTSKLTAAKLRQVKSDLSAMSEGPSPILHALAIEREVALKTMTMENIGILVQAVDPNTKEEELAKKAEELGGEQFLAKCRVNYSTFMDNMIETIAADKPYIETYTALKKQSEDLENSRDDFESVFTNILVPALTKVYVLQIRHRVQSHANIAALEILAQAAEKGRLPATLPAGQPKDLYSGKDFQYTRSPEGFVLTANAKDLDKEEIQKFEFKFRK